MKYRFVRIVLLAVIGFGLSGCANTPPGLIPQDVVIIIEFNGDCPTGPAAGPIPVGRAGAGDKLVFKSRPAGKDFTITFSPAAGRSRHATQGEVMVPLQPKALPVYTDQNEFKFKYSISAANCPQIDPMVIIKR